MAQIITSYMFSSGDIESVRPSIRVDIVSMPSQTLKEMQNIDQNIVEKASASKPSAEIADGKAEGGFLSQLKKLSKKKVKIKETTNKNAKAKDHSGLIRAGNKLSKGSAITGKVAAESQELFINYLEGVVNRVRQFWKLPGYLQDQELRCRIRLFLKRDGSLARIVVYETSGNKDYDQLAQQSIRAADVFSVPDSSIVDRVISGDIILGFPL